MSGIDAADWAFGRASPFESYRRQSLARIVGISIILHAAVVVSILLSGWLLPEPEAKKIPIFELIDVKQPPSTRSTRPPPPSPATPEPVKQQPKTTPKPVPAQPKPVPQTKNPVPLPKPQETPVPQPAEVKADAKPAAQPTGTPHSSDMELPDFGDEPQLRMVESMLIDPLLQQYLDQLVRILLQNFNPPDGIDIPGGAKTTVQFTIERSGQITGIALKKSSTNGIWDQLAVRAVKISRLPPLPANFRAPVLPLVFDFKEK